MEAPRITSAELCVWRDIEFRSDRGVFRFYMPRKKQPLKPFTVLVPSSLQIESIAAATNTKPDLIAAVLFQFAHTMTGQSSEDGWVRLSRDVVRKVHRRADYILKSLEALGIVQVKRNANGRKSYIGIGFGKRKPQSTSYRINPIHKPESMKEYDVLDRTVSKALWAMSGGQPEAAKPTPKWIRDRYKTSHFPTGNRYKTSHLEAEDRYKTSHINISTLSKEKEPIKTSKHLYIGNGQADDISSDDFWSGLQNSLDEIKTSVVPQMVFYTGGVS